MNERLTCRRRYLRAVGALVAGITWSTTAVGSARADDDIIEFDSGSTDRCSRFVEYETSDGEEFESCTGPEGGFVEEIDDDGDEERTEFDSNGTVRRRVEEDADGDEEEWVYDENGTLRFRREEDADGDEEERVYDENGTLRFRRDEDDDGDEKEWQFDENGTLRVFDKDDEDGDDVRRIYDVNGTLISSHRDDDDLDFDD
ncbi:hypothetical protein E6P09_15705 (plasmid) [Haloferax mediterranei ATCC 33500]|uniref:Uncharacterized protein n=1 Tax=Haloferax mediterranei (strain ATCC 33500 / DSM 1411 / JCM 8866 / NBRC 14739 / NCIMB 2177 / R-4) TaxID=523841 RepID=I3RBG3_HALMT|nr:hypothetical protein [Haloferax mediterranei]AFK21573.1 hypothetical protein HFX_6456 [Haloferax mediterranei ATCC 33500]AHZ24377.1 hypothetical protein BM92_15770 [Haloferax mediterranei ATCC 33500]ELZ97116.1 hypothetical protein C439_17378 [Haloferax mediterranei ATCC 33500]MDX5990140.1 hypothetical protein [Haloferax mediterranei ATCC 33500]QCQ76781.1 hypothetical protein E6P09_15705 [Haloferax mediterranei ATCC 33500]